MTSLKQARDQQPPALRDIPGWMNPKDLIVIAELAAAVPPDGLGRGREPGEAAGLPGRLAHRRQLGCGLVGSRVEGFHDVFLGSGIGAVALGCSIDDQD